MGIIINRNRDNSIKKGLPIEGTIHSKDYMKTLLERGKLHKNRITFNRGITGGKNLTYLNGKLYTKRNIYRKNYI